MGFRKKFTAATIALAVAALSWAFPASASSHNPTGEFAPFAECPWFNPNVTECLIFVSNGGSLTVGAKTIPFKNPITLQGGSYEGGSGIQFVGAENGDTLSKTPQPVPGGLVGVTAPTSWPHELQTWFNELIGTGFTGVNATMELAAPASSITLNTENLILEEGTALGLPVKIKLDNPILGNNCYIGTNEEPVQLELTTGTSGLLTGNLGELTFNEEFTLITISGLKLVDGTFEAPNASGCGGIFSEYLDPLVDSLFELPAGPEENAAVLQGVLKVANAEAVIAADM